MGFQNGPPFRPNVSGIIVLATLSSLGNCLHFGPLSEILGRYFLLTLLSISVKKMSGQVLFRGTEKEPFWRWQNILFLNHGVGSLEFRGSDFGVTFLFFRVSKLGLLFGT